MNLQAFLNPKREQNMKYVASERFVDENGPIEWEIRSLTSEEDEVLRKACTKKVPLAGRKGQFIPELDYNQYAGKLAAACTVYPDLQDRALQDGYQVMGEDHLLKAMLKPGEYTEYLQKVQEVNGFHTNIEELIDEAKN